MRERNKTVILIVLISVVFLVLVLESETGLIGKASSIFTGTNVMVSPNIIVIYTRFSGNTTDFSSMNFTDMFDIYNMDLQIPTYGEMVFSEIVNLTKCRDEEFVVNLNEHVDITTNSVTINATGLPCMNKSATISLYQINFSNPRILRNGEPCPSDVCTIVSYERGVLFVFNVTGFTVYTVTTYSVEETGLPSPGGGIGPVVPGPIYNFTVDKKFFKVFLKQGETLLDSFTINNTGTVRLRVSIDVNNLERYTVLSEDMFYLEQGESKTISVAFTASEYEEPDVYPGRFIIDADSIRKIILVVIEVRERRPLFDILVSTEETPQRVYLGEEVEADILMYNFGDLKPVDVSLYYSLRDFDGNDILYAEESFAVQEQKEVKKKIRIPEDLEPGYYLFYSRLTYANESLSSSAIVLVQRMEERFYLEPWMIIGVLIIVIIAILASFFIQMRKYRRIWSAKAPGKKHELKGIEKEVGKETIKIKVKQKPEWKEFERKLFRDIEKETKKKKKSV
ncbi:MAG: hypothetical protein JSW41_01875 [Candidatus Aenigmatarchaeota archaeon]|nr:MAG: hypothetical protein JSW41_01875 [Candidatus Aenigmarchaeota archaeon]